MDLTLSFSNAQHYWEALAGVVIAQQSDITEFVTHDDEHRWLLEQHGLTPVEVNSHATALRFEEAYDSRLSPADWTYIETLAHLSGVPCPFTLPLLNVPAGSYSDGKYIVLAYGAIHEDFRLPVTMWRAILRLAKSYADKIYMIGNGQRPDIALMESEILFDAPLKEKYDILAGSSLVIGLPNDWTWIASAWRKKIAMLYPDSQPPKKWFPFADNNFGRILYRKEQINPPQLMADIRTLLTML